MSETPAPPFKPRGRGRGQPFEKGHTRSGGMQKGFVFKELKELRSLAQRLLSDPIYQKNLLKRLRAGTAGPIEPLLYHYLVGKPKETVEHSGPGGQPLELVRVYVPDNARDH